MWEFLSGGASHKGIPMFEKWIIVLLVICVILVLPLY
jgi:hypothetical protein